MRLTLAAMMMALPAAAFAAGGDNDTPKPVTEPKPCKNAAKIRNALGFCVKPKQSSLDAEQMIQTARFMAYDGRYETAQSVLLAMPDQNDDLVLTYWGFTSRKMGDVDTALAFYDRAIAQNPDNFLARSYLGQHFVETGALDAAKEQLAEIEARGGGYTWAGTSLRQAVYVGTTFNY